ncbi:unnamed protein product [Caenorhabditis nigoni]
MAPNDNGRTPRKRRPPTFFDPSSNKKPLSEVELLTQKCENAEKLKQKYENKNKVLRREMKKLYQEKYEWQLKMTNSQRQHDWQIANLKADHEKEKANHEKEKADHEKEKAGHEQEIKRLEASNVELRHRMREWKSLKDNKELVKTVTNARNDANYHRQKALECLSMYLKGQEDLSGVLKLWKMCDVCRREFGSEPNTTPRVLFCGHTICEDCIDHIIKGDALRCPLCRSFCYKPDLDANHFPKNFLALDM